MRLVDVVDEIGETVESIAGLRVYTFTPDSIVPPAAIIQVRTMNYDQAFQRGLDRWDGNIVVCVSDVFDRAAFNNLADYVDANSTSPSNIHSALRARETWTSCAYVRSTVCRIPPGGFAFNNVVYAGAEIDLDIAGTG